MSNVLGIGNDLIEVHRIRSSLEAHGDHFLNKLFTDAEIDYCKKKHDAAIHFAGRFAAKEALAKAFGSGFGKDLEWKDVEVLPDERGKPIVYLSENIQKRYPKAIAQVSISHTKELASAFAILLLKD